MSQEKSKIMPMQILGGRGGIKRCIVGFVQVLDIPFSQLLIAILGHVITTNFPAKHSAYQDSNLGPLPS